MDLPSDSETQLLVETYLEPLTRSSPMGIRNPDSELSEDDCSAGQESSDVSKSENKTRRVARRKLLVACAVSLVFMAGEVIGEMRIRGSQFGHHDGRGSPSDGLRQHRDQHLLPGGFVQASNSNHDFRLAPSRMVLILHQSGASHGHNHEVPIAQRDKRTRGRHHGNASVKAAFVHVLGDLLQSVGVLLAASIIHFWPEYKVADPLCTFLFSVVVVGTTLPVSKAVFRILMEGAPQGVGSVREQLLSVGEVKAVNGLHTWSLNMDHSLLSAHIAIDEGADSQIVLRKATKLLRSKFGFSSITIQVERCKASSKR
ncbi:zinc transporter 2-like isoform X2 [Xiphophorus maculatus]|uniref:zinc transporter 2-like isoform X2 n=1 Tax=Xiphophorus maculatus TaxID=8083 RepID=UPI000C6E76EA|nr:zinc transporter 2-like isoform X2 [Xiphophorus maculatus]